MRKISVVLSVSVFVAMILAACGGEETSPSIPTENVPPVTVDVTETVVSSIATEMPTKGTVTETPGVPVTGENNASRLSNELEFPVLRQDGQQIGDVSDMVLDLDNIRITYVVVSADGREVAVPWDSLTLQVGTSSNTSGQQNAFILQTDQETFNNAPGVDINAILPATGQPAGNWDAEISSYWQNGGTISNPPAVSGTLSPDMTATSGTGTGLATATVTGDATAMPEETTTLATGGQGIGLGIPLQGAMLATEVLRSSISVGNQGQGTGNGQGNGTSNGTGLATATPTTGVSLATETATPSVGLATATSGTDTGSATATPGTGSGAELATATTSGTDPGNYGLGNAEATIDDLLIDTNTGDIHYIVVDAMFDSSEHWIPVPLSLLQWDVTNQGFVVNVNPATLAAAPSFENGQYLDTSTSGWDSDISSFWQSNGSGQGSGGGSGTNSQATATPTP